ncbi:MAG: phage tail tape measure protein, partial [Lachnospiraceae bacterium]|nr:phage tail tape measure protein [Lachnospiraceae bacterium]
ALKELNKLGVDLWDDKGKFVGFKEGLDQINEAMSDLTDEQRTRSLKNVAGTHYYSQMAYLLEAVDQDESDVSAWDVLEGRVTNSTGALENMYDITTDTLENAQKRLESAKEDMQIRLVDVFSDDAKDFVSWLAESLPYVTESIVDFAEAHQGEFAKALEGLGEGIENLWEFGITAGQWIIKHKGAITGALSGMASGMILLKTAMMGINIAKFFTNPVSAAVTVAGLAITAITGIRGAIRDAEEAAVSADLASHFGAIALSMKDIEQISERIVGSESLAGVINALEEFNELDSISAVMEDAVKDLDKMNWKISIGLELSDDEKESYKRAIDDYISSAQEYAQQTQYAVSLNMEYAFGESFSDADSITAKVNQFYSDNYMTLQELGTDLNNAMTEAFNDGLLEIGEVETISNIQRQMADIQKAMAAGDFEAKLSMLSMDYSG